jgi:hypothetical protein
MKEAPEDVEMHAGAVIESEEVGDAEQKDDAVRRNYYMNM